MSIALAFRVANKLLVIQHVQHEGPDLIAELARERGMAVQTLWPASGDDLPRPEACINTIAVVLGGPMGVDDRRHPGMEWLQRELTRLADSTSAQGQLSQAIELARDGASVSEIMLSTKMPKEEAEAVARYHSAQKE